MSCIYCCTKILISYYLFAKVSSNAIFFFALFTPLVVFLSSYFNTQPKNNAFRWSKNY